MKKIVVTFAIAALFCGMIFADGTPVVTISDWGRQIFALGNLSGNDSLGGSGLWMGSGTSWGNTPRITGLTISGHTDFAGFAITPSADAGSFSLTDENKAWVNPMPGLQVETGLTLETDTWRGTGDFGTWDWMRVPGMHGDSVTFLRLGENGVATDINYNKDGIGLWALVSQPSNTALTSDNSNFENALQAGAAYTFKGVGQVKAQFLGYAVGKEYDNGSGGAGALGVAQAIQTGTYNTINAAFNLQVIKDLYEEIGIFVPTSSSNAGYNFQVTDYSNLKVGSAQVHVLVLVTDYNGNLAGLSSGIGFEGGLGLDYDLGNAFSVGGDVRYINALQENGGANEAASNGLGDETAVLIDISKGFPNGSIGIGFQYSTNGFDLQSGTVDHSNGHWAIPVSLSEWF